MSEPRRAAVVVPVWNEAGRLQRDAFLEFLGSHSGITICFVNDGSTDDSAAVLQHLVDARPGQVEVVHQPVNRGKAEAVRSGLRWAAEQGFAQAAYLDADLAAPLDAALLLLDELDRDPRLTLVMGSRVKLLGWRVVRSERRHYLGRVFATFASITLDLPVYDTQCGAKALRLDPRTMITLAEPFLSRWLFDVELIARFRDALGASTIREVPLPTWVDNGGSSLRLRDYLRAPWELWKIRRRYPPTGPAAVR